MSNARDEAGPGSSRLTAKCRAALLRGTARPNPAFSPKTKSARAKGTRYLARDRKNLKPGAPANNYVPVYVAFFFSMNALVPIRKSFVEATSPK